MTWQAPWVWSGAILIVLPIVIHLLGQGRARRLPFPSLRFFGAARPLPARRTRVHDALLLLVRIAILLAAVMALARPVLRTTAIAAGTTASVARAIIVDTSASMHRPAVAGTPAIDAALGAAARMADSAAVGITLRTIAPADAIRGAIEWLDRQEGMSELAIVSDFQRGTIDSADIAAIPPRIGVRLVPIHLLPDSTPLAMHLAVGPDQVTARAALAADQTDVTWTADRATDGAERGSIALLIGPADSAVAGAAQQAAATIGITLPLDRRRQIAIVYPAFPGRAALLQHATRLHASWMADALARIARDPLLQDVASGVAAGMAADSANAGALLATRFGSLSIVVAADSAGGSDRLLLLPAVDPGSIASAALIAAARRSVSVDAPAAEFEPATLPDQQLSAWSRPPTPRTAPRPGTDRSDGRWFWVAALVLLTIESIMRHGMTRTAAGEVVRDAAA